ncbi:MAG: chemoreceptor glutamine deamidase CheD [Thiotrichales bacterium]|jgi:chemotaxis protein CheD|nr:chemoreceptor glutamine deamidase CheD [Pseudomonadota bacterium]MCI4412167.1 chemoreceptor glutamine deamidase CheD [Thiotrichales bacterium]
MQKNFDLAESMNSIKILPGEFYVTNTNEKIETVLGSCISVCVRDPVAGVGGMNHFMLPVDKQPTGVRTELADANRYGNYAMENMINAVLKMGAQRGRLEFKIFGGARIMSQLTNVGWYNIGFTFDYLFTEGFRIVSQDIGDIYPRKIMYYPLTGRVRVRRLNAMHSQTLVAEEAQYQKRVDSKPVEGDIELF